MIKLAEAEVTLKQVTTSVDSHSENLHKQVHKFNVEQSSIDRRLLILTQSETSDDAVYKFDVTMAKLRQLDIAKAYVDRLAEVDHLRRDSLPAGL